MSLSETTLRMTATGTLVGMPALRTEGFDAFHPERWSHPPPPGTAPIVPCDDPEDEVSALLESPWRYAARPIPTPLPTLPTRRVMSAEERTLLARAALVAVAVVCVVVALVAI